MQSSEEREDAEKGQVGRIQRRSLVTPDYSHPAAGLEFPGCHLGVPGMCESSWKDGDDPSCTCPAPKLMM